MSPTVELRVLNGRHSGARASVQGGESIGVSDACDLVLTDIGIGEDVAAWLMLRAGVWGLAAEKPQQKTVAPAATESAADEPGASVMGTPFGDVAFLGDVALTVCEQDAPWQSVPTQPRVVKKDRGNELNARTEGASPTEAQVHVAALGNTDDKMDSVSEAAEATVVVNQRSESANKPKARSVPVWWFIALALLALLVTVLWSVLGQQRSPVPETVSAATAPRPSLTAQPQMVREAQLAIARVDPSLRLNVEGVPDGRVRVSGWVSDVNQLDRLAEKLATLRPLPQLAVRTVADVMDDLKEAARSAGIRKPGFEPLGSGHVKALGLVMDDAERSQAMQTLRSSMPSTLSIDDGLRTASSQGPAMQEWLAKGGFAGAKAEWKNASMHLYLAMAPQERPRLENLLARADGLMSEVPFTLHVEELALTEPRVVRRMSGAAAAAPEAPLIHVSAAPLPFHIRSVVGGSNAYVILSDGSKLQPGGLRGGWRLDAVDAQTLTFSGPKKLVLAR